MARPAWTAQCTNRKLIGELLPVRRRESHKGDYGRVLLLCGSEGLTGAARLAAKAALRTGSGLVYLGVPEKIYPIIAAGAGSEIVFPLPCDEAGRLCMAALPAITARLPEMDAVLLGPGLGRSEELTRLVQAVARHPGALKKTIFELQARDWNRRQQNAIPDQQLADWMRLLRLNGVKNYGYYPDDFINNQPDISRIRPQFSSWWYPDHD